MGARTVTLANLSTLPSLMAGAGSFASDTVLDAPLRSLTAGGWSVVLPEDSLVVGMPRGPGAARRLRRALGQLGPGAPVAVISRMPIGSRRMTRLAARGGLVVQRQLVALPRLGGACYLVEDDAAALRWLLSSVLTVPPGVNRAAMLQQLAIRLARDVLPVQTMSWLLPHRVVLAVRA
jgi:hypothetical protein